MKQETRKLISGLIAAALMTSIFTGCSKQEESGIPFSSTSVVSDVETPTGETKLYRDETLDMRYKNWYDNPEITHSQTAVYDDIRQTRDPETGQLQHDPDADNDIAKISEDLVPSSKYEDYTKDTSLAAFTEDTDYKVFLNNADTGDTFNTSDLVMPVSKWLSTQHIASFRNITPPTLHIATAAGQDAITFEIIDDPDDDFDGGWLIKYLDGAFEQTAAASEVVVSDEVLNLTPKAVETILGLKIIVNDEHKVINIVTDNKDLVVETDDQPGQPSAPTTPGNDDPTSESTNEPTSNDEPTSQPSSGSQTPSNSTSEWTETTITQATMYVNVNSANSRTKAVVGAPGVKTYYLNDAVTVTAKTNTGYYKLSDGSFMHSDYLQTTKVVQQPSTSTTTPSGSTPSSNQYTGLTPTDTTSMELDANGFPANPTRGQKFVDKTGQMWQYASAHWYKLGSGSHGSASTTEGTGEMVGH